MTATDRPDAPDDDRPDADLRASGTARPVTIMGEQVLAVPAAPVTEFGDQLRALVADMYASMYAARGVGLAANQIGVGRSVFVIDCPDDDLDRLTGHVVNPVFEILDHTPRDGDEGCLSVPGPRAAFPRPAAAAVTGVDWAGRPVRLVGHGLAARCLQHETDHLAGHLYLDRLDADDRAAVIAEYERLRTEATATTPADADATTTATADDAGAAS